MIRTIRGRPVDRPPVWVSRHSGKGTPETAEEMFERERQFQEAYDWDMARISPAAAIYVEDWGCTFGVINRLGVPKPLGHAIRELADWEELPELNPETGRLGAVARATGLLSRWLSNRKPILITAFSPLNIAEKLAGASLLRETMKRDPELLKHALEIITNTTIRFIRCAAQQGGNALYFATQTANYQLSDRQFATFAKPYDERILQSVRPQLLFSILHLHGDDLRKELFSAYPVDVVHWADRRTRPAITLAEGRQLTAKCLMGGINGRKTLCVGSQDEVVAEIEDALRQVPDGKLILSPCCVIPIVGVPAQNIAAVSACVKYEHSRRIS